MKDQSLNTNSTQTLKKSIIEDDISKKELLNRLQKAEEKIEKLSSTLSIMSDSIGTLFISLGRFRRRIDPLLEEHISRTTQNLLFLRQMIELQNVEAAPPPYTNT
jgi:hypothetical protein